MGKWDSPPEKVWMNKIEILFKDYLNSNKMQLTRYENLTPNNIIFKEAKYKRIPIETKYPDGKKGAIVIETPFLFSFGVNEKRSQETSKLAGYSIPVCLWEEDGQPNDPERDFYELICKFTDVCP